MSDIDTYLAELTDADRAEIEAASKALDVNEVIELRRRIDQLWPLARAAVAWWRADDETLAEAHGRLLTALADLDPAICKELEAE